ncbi:MAG: VacJ family lipoprotein [Woeseia sp.]
MPVTRLLRNPIYAVFLLSVSLGGCAGNSTKAGEEGQTNVESSTDPWEQRNRGVFDFNRALDRVTLKPIAEGYDKVVPLFMRRGISNFYTNLRGPRNILNNFLQGKGTRGFSETGRFLVNSTIGVLGLVDVASAMGLDKHREDFGQTLAVWGVPDGPYVMIPFGGPQTLRDAFAYPIDILADPLWHYENDSVRYPLYALRFIEYRAGFLSAQKVLDESFDPYIRLREAYLQNRRFEVYDGDPPVDDDFYDDFYDDLPEPEPENQQQPQ